MKKLSIICATALVLATSSCTKTQESIESGELVKVTFNVSAFDVNVEPMTKTSVNASDGLTKLDYLIVSSGKSINGTQTISANPDEFGTIELWLSPGTYTAYFAGYAGDGVLRDAGNKEYRIQTTNAETFYFKNTLTISASENTYNIQLERLSGKLVIDITDENVPNDIKGVKVSFAPVDIYQVKDELTITSTAITNDINVANGVFPEYGYFMFATQRAEDLLFQLIASDNSVLGECYVQYNIYKNKKTIVRGNILDIITQKGLSITYNDEWGTDVVVPIK